MREDVVASGEGAADRKGALTPEIVSRARELERAAELLASCGVEEARLDARLLLLAAAHITRADLLLEPDAPLDEASLKRFNHYVSRRAAREPLSRILGVRGFWTLDLAVAPNVLDPRADTETLVELAVRELQARRNEPLSILDLGAGSGAILCALLYEFSQARGVAVDRSTEACNAAAGNFRSCGISDRASVLRGNWAEALRGKFDLVVSNPPYIRSCDIESLAPEVRLYDPAVALDGGADGLDCYRVLANEIPRLLSINGLAVLEVGAGQAEPVSRLFEESDLKIVATAKDAGGHERALAARRREA